MTRTKFWRRCRGFWQRVCEQPCIGFCVLFILFVHLSRVCSSVLFVVHPVLSVVAVCRCCLLVCMHVNSVLVCWCVSVLFCFCLSSVSCCPSVLVLFYSSNCWCVLPVCSVFVYSYLLFCLVITVHLLSSFFLFWLVVFSPLFLFTCFFLFIYL